MQAAGSVLYPIEEFTQKRMEIRENRGIMVAGILTSRFTLFIGNGKQEDLQYELEF
jgi:hypothetical protein